MIYTVSIKSYTYELPAKSLAITEKLDKAATVDARADLSIRDKYKVVLDTVSDILGKDKVKEAFGTDKLEEMDLTEITLAFRKIVDAYNKPLEEYNNNLNKSSLEGLPIEQLVALSDASKNLLALAEQQSK